MTCHTYTSHVTSHDITHVTLDYRSRMHTRTYAFNFMPSLSLLEASSIYIYIYAYLRLLWSSGKIKVQRCDRRFHYVVRLTWPRHWHLLPLAMACIAVLPCSWHCSSNVKRHVVAMWQRKVANGRRQRSGLVHRASGRPVR